MVLLSRRQETYQPIVEAVEASGGIAWGISADVTDPAQIERAIEQARSHLEPNTKLAAAIFNVAVPFTPAPFLEIKPADLQNSFGGTACVHSARWIKPYSLP